MQRQILFWSKYSSNCKKFITEMKQNDITIESVCIDNKKIRRRINNDSKIKINVVPTIVITYPYGLLEKYEGAKAFELLDAMISFKNPVVEPIVKKMTSNDITSNDITSNDITSNDITSNDITSNDITSNDITSNGITTSNGMTSLDDLSDEEDILKPEKSNEIEKDPNRGNTDNNLPIKSASQVSNKAAEIAKNRELMDSFIKKPTQNNINPKI
jgi:hypothetical protein